MISHTKKYGVYHWDTFDNTTLLMFEDDTFSNCFLFISDNYGKRVHPDGADVVEIVTRKGNIMHKENVK